MSFNIMRKNFFQFFQSKSDLKNDVELTKGYFRCCSFFGIFPWCLRKEQSQLLLVSKWYISFIFVLILTGAIVAYPVRIKFVYKYMESVQIVVDIIKHIVEYSSTLFIVNAALRSNDAWRLSFQHLTQLDNKLRSKGVLIDYHKTLNTLKLVGYHLVFLILVQDKLFKI